MPADLSGEATEDYRKLVRNLVQPAELKVEVGEVRDT